jgi:hypothetical protein
MKPHPPETPVAQQSGVEGGAAGHRLKHGQVFRGGKVTASDSA